MWFVANGATMVTALAASAVVNRMAAPIWLVAPGHSALPASAQRFLN